MGNICCGDTSTDNLKINGKIKTSQSDEDNSIQGSNQESLELQHISEREYGNTHFFLSLARTFFINSFSSNVPLPAPIFWPNSKPNIVYSVVF